MHANGKTFDFIIFKGLGDLIRSIFYANFLMTQAENKQNETETLLRGFDANKPQGEDKKQSRKEILYHTIKLFEGRRMIINAFENGTFPLPEKHQNEELPEEEKEEEYIPPKERSEIIAEEEKGINNYLFYRLL